jgi:hypothetical protein
MNIFDKLWFWITGGAEDSTKTLTNTVPDFEPKEVQPSEINTVDETLETVVTKVKVKKPKKSKAKKQSDSQKSPQKKNSTKKPRKSNKGSV